VKTKPHRPHVAIAKVVPVYLDAKASISKALQMIQQAKQQNAELVLAKPGCWEQNAKVLQSAICTARLRTFSVYHRPEC
jgi:hypothetical protein